MAKKWTTVEVLRHARHDWMNDLQLIKANLSLNRIERANEIIDEIIRSARNESNVMNLNTPELFEYLITFNWSKHPIDLKFQVDGKVRDLHTYEETLLNGCRLILSLLNSHASMKTENKIRLTIATDPLLLSFHFTGGIENREMMEDALEDFKKTHKTFSIIESYIRQDELFLSLTFVD
ncbi:Spo0B domain-containing protein [Fictibacillus sp. Mic-4]|uniref:Spo0B domain-containing protein n=1 Tax=Fictibacillus sp. Mic-4 TaxID=3132826 RepID=UPI003CEA34D3